MSAAAAAILPVVPLPPLAVADVRLAETLQLVADTIVESLGFDVAVINLVDDDVQSMVVAAVSGPDEVREALLNRRQGLKGWAELVAASEPWGRLRFLDHNTTVADPADILTWIPDLPVSDDPNAWHPEDALFAPLESSDGRPLGMLSVDVPRDGMRPAPAIRHALEAFVVTAALAIQHATLAADARRAAARFQAVFDASPIPVALLGPDKCFSSLNDAFCRFLGRSRDELVGLDPLDLTHPDDKAATVALSLDVRSAGSAAVGGPIEKRYVLPDGSIAWARLHLAALGSDLDPGFLIAQLEDITERRHAEERLLKQAHFDSLTGLPNRSQSMRKLRAALRAAEHDETTAVFFCDLDRLKLVNDAHGHAVGDSYIRAVSARIRATVRGGDTVGRLSGDEFVVVLPGLRSPSEAVTLAARVIESVRQPMRVGGVVFSPSLSLGIAYRSGSAQSAESADELLAQADSAMYHAKTQHRGSWHIFDQSLKTSAVAQLQLRTDISSALRHDEFVLHYQPIVRLSDGVTVAREALLRWQHPRRGQLTPAEFLDVVVDSEYETAVTEWAVRRACLDAAARPSGPRRVHVNISSVQIGRADLIEHVLACLSESGLEPNDLVLELTEDRLLSRPDAHELVERLRSLGVSLAIDDFGTGYAGLQYLRRFATLDIVKLDRSFVADIGQGGISEHIIRAMIDVARSSGLTLVTEGVETQQQADFLRAAGAEYAQGYHFGGPEPAPAVC